MSNPTRFEAHVGALIRAYSDRAPTVVDPIAMARISAAAGSARRPSSIVRPTQDGVRLLLVLGLLAALSASALVAAGQALLREADPIVSDRLMLAPFDGLPPAGAPASSPEHGELVLSFVARVKGVGDDVHAMWLYEDGRLIWRRNLDRLTENGARRSGR